jgi:hypothetical protein
MAKIDITTAGHTIIVEDDNASLDAVAIKALELWWATRDPKIDRSYGITAGTTTDRGEIYTPAFGANLGGPR